MERNAFGWYSELVETFLDLIQSSCFFSNGFNILDGPFVFISYDFQALICQPFLIFVHLNALIIESL